MFAITNGSDEHPMIHNFWDTSRFRMSESFKIPASKSYVRSYYLIVGYLLDSDSIHQHPVGVGRDPTRDGTDLDF